MTETDARLKLEAELKKKFKISAIDYDNLPATGAYSTGAIELDLVSGIGGFPKGKMIEIFGPESGGKSIILLQAIANAQKIYGKPSAYFDLESATPPSWMTTLGIDMANLTTIPSDPELYAERALDMVTDMIRANIYAYIGIDSVVGLVPKAEMDGSLEKHTMAELARVMSRSLKQLVPELRKSDTCVVFINQIREKVGQMFGNPETTPGGRALKFFASQRYRVSPQFGAGSKFTEKGTQIGHTVKIKNVKNKLAAPTHEGTFDVYYTSGIDAISNLFKNGVKYNVITKEKQTYSYTIPNPLDPETEPIQKLRVVGKDAFKDELLHDAASQALIYNDILAKFMKGDLIESELEDDDFDNI